MFAMCITDNAVCVSLVVFEKGISLMVSCGHGLELLGMEYALDVKNFLQ